MPEFIFARTRQTKPNQAKPIQTIPSLSPAPNIPTPSTSLAETLYTRIILPRPIPRHTLPQLHILPLLRTRNRISIQHPRGTTTPIPQLLQPLLILAIAEDFLHLQLANRTEHTLRINKLLLREQLPKSRRGDPGWCAEAGVVVVLGIFVFAVCCNVRELDIIAIRVQWRRLGRLWWMGWTRWRFELVLVSAWVHGLETRVRLALSMVLRIARGVRVLGKWYSGIGYLDQLARVGRHTRLRSMLNVMLRRYSGLEHAGWVMDWWWSGCVAVWKLGETGLLFPVSDLVTALH